MCSSGSAKQNEEIAKSRGMLTEALRVLGMASSEEALETVTTSQLKQQLGIITGRMVPKLAQIYVAQCEDPLAPSRCGKHGEGKRGDARVQRNSR